MQKVIMKIPFSTFELYSNFLLLISVFRQTNKKLYIANKNTQLNEGKYICNWPSFIYLH